MIKRNLLLSAALAAALAACGSQSEPNQAVIENAIPAPIEDANTSADTNLAAPAGNVGQPAEQAAPTNTVRAEPARRAPPAQKAEPSPRPSEPADPHAGHDMSNMSGNHQGTAS